MNDINELFIKGYYKDLLFCKLSTNDDLNNNLFNQINYQDNQDQLANFLNQYTSSIFFPEYFNNICFGDPSEETLNENTVNADNPHLRVFSNKKNNPYCLYYNLPNKPIILKDLIKRKTQLFKNYTLLTNKSNLTKQNFTKMLDVSNQFNKIYKNNYFTFNKSTNKILELVIDNPDYPNTLISRYPVNNELQVDYLFWIIITKFTSNNILLKFNYSEKNKNDIIFKKQNQFFNCETISGVYVNNQQNDQCILQLYDQNHNPIYIYFCNLFSDITVSLDYTIQTEIIENYFLSQQGGKPIRVSENEIKEQISRMKNQFSQDRRDLISTPTPDSAPDSAPSAPQPPPDPVSAPQPPTTPPASAPQPPTTPPASAPQPPTTPPASAPQLPTTPPASAPQLPTTPPASAPQSPTTPPANSTEQNQINPRLIYEESKREKIKLDTIKSAQQTKKTTNITRQNDYDKKNQANIRLKRLSPKLYSKIYLQLILKLKNNPELFVSLKNIVNLYFKNEKSISISFITNKLNQLENRKQYDYNNYQQSYVKSKESLLKFFNTKNYENKINSNIECPINNNSLQDVTGGGSVSEMQDGKPADDDNAEEPSAKQATSGRFNPSSSQQEIQQEKKMKTSKKEFRERKQQQQQAATKIQSQLRGHLARSQQPLQNVNLPDIYNDNNENKFLKSIFNIIYLINLQSPGINIQNAGSNLQCNSNDENITSSNLDDSQEEFYRLSYFKNPIINELLSDTLMEMFNNIDRISGKNDPCDNYVLETVKFHSLVFRQKNNYCLNCNDMLTKIYGDNSLNFDERIKKYNNDYYDLLKANSQFDIYSRFLKQLISKKYRGILSSSSQEFPYIYPDMYRFTTTNKCYDSNNNLTCMAVNLVRAPKILNPSMSTAKKPTLIQSISKRPVNIPVRPVNIPVRPVDTPVRPVDTPVNNSSQITAEEAVLGALAYKLKSQTVPSGGANISVSENNNDKEDNDLNLANYTLKQSDIDNAAELALTISNQEPLIGGGVKCSSDKNNFLSYIKNLYKIK